MKLKFAKTSLFVDRKGKNDTGLPAHCLDTDFSHRFDFDNAEMLCRETHWGKRLKKEAMYIGWNGGEHFQYPEGQRFEPYLGTSAAALFIVGFLGPGMGTARWLVFCCSVIAERILFRDGHRHVRFYISSRFFNMQLQFSW